MGVCVFLHWWVVGVDFTWMGDRSPGDAGPSPRQQHHCLSRANRPPTCSPTQSGQNQLSAFQRGFNWLPSESARFSFQCIFKRISNSFAFNSLPCAGPTIMWSSPLAWASSPVYAHHIGDELSRQLPHCSELQFAFWKSASGSIVFPEIELAHQQTLNSSLLSPPPTSPLSLSLSSVSVRSFNVKTHTRECFYYYMLTKEAHFKLEEHFILCNC